MKKYRLKITPLAEQDLSQAGDYIAIQLKNPDAALRTVQGIIRTINTLQTMPLRHELLDDPLLAEYNLRIIYFKNYKIFYVVHDDEVHIIRILHKLVDSPALLYHTFNPHD